MCIRDSSRIDFAEETKALKELMEEFQAAKSAEEQFRVHQKYYERTRHIQTEMALASTRNSLDTSDVFYDQEKDYYDLEYPAYSNLAVEYAKLLLKDVYKRQEYEKDIEIHLGLEVEYYPKYFRELLHITGQYPIEYFLLAQHFLGNEIDDVYSGDETRDPKLLERYCLQCREAMMTGCFTYFAHPDLCLLYTSRCV